MIILSMAWSHLGHYTVGMLQLLYNMGMVNISEWFLHNFLSNPVSAFYPFHYGSPGNQYQEVLLFEWRQYFYLHEPLKMLARKGIHKKILNEKLEDGISGTSTLSSWQHQKKKILMRLRQWQQQIQLAIYMVRFETEPVHCIHWVNLHNIFFYTIFSFKYKGKKKILGFIKKCYESR